MICSPFTGHPVKGLHINWGDYFLCDLLPGVYLSSKQVKQKTDILISILSIPSHSPITPSNNKIIKSKLWQVIYDSRKLLPKEFISE